MKHLPTFLAVCFVAAGCTGSDNGDVEKARLASEQAPKSAADLPTSMPAQAQKQASAAMAQQQAMQQQMDAQAAAMKRALGNK